MEELSQNQFEALEKGDESAFEEIYRQYYEPVYYLALKILQRPHDAEDAVQQTFLRAFENIKAVKNYRSFRTWLFRIAHHECINILRTRRNIVLTEDALWGDFSKAAQNDLMLPQEYIERKDLIQLIHGVIDDLPALQREALALEIVHGMSMEQIAEVTESNVNTVKSRIYYARQKIRDAVRTHEQENKTDLNGAALVPLSVVFLQREQEEPPSKKKIDLGWKELRRQLDDEDDDTTDEQITPPATQAPSSAPATQAPTESPLSPAYRAYRELLDNEHFALEEFGNFNRSVRQIALAEVYDGNGGDTPELLFLTGSPGDSSCQLVVATYQNGSTTVLNRTYNIPMDSGFGLFLSDGVLYSCITDTNDNSASEVSYFRYDDSSTLPYHYNILQDTLLMHMNDNDGYHYSLSDAGEVTENEFNTAQSELLDKVDAVLFTLNSEKLPAALVTAIGRAEQLGMTTTEAQRRLGAE